VRTDVQVPRRTMPLVSGRLPMLVRPVPKGGATPVKLRRLPVVAHTAPPERPEPVDRDQAITAIRAALKRRSGKSWSVRGGRGTTWGWITITAPPSRLAGDEMTTEDAAELADLLGLDLDQAHLQGVLVPDSNQDRREYIGRAEGAAAHVVPDATARRD